MFKKLPGLIKYSFAGTILSNSIIAFADSAPTNETPLGQTNNYPTIKNFNLKFKYLENSPCEQKLHSWASCVDKNKQGFI